MRKRSRKLEEEEECCSTRVHKLDKHENVGEDKISNLPQDILHHIFTFLDTKQTTCLLSRRWRHFWVSIPTLKFTYLGGKGDRTKANRNEFMDFVDRVLMFRGNSDIHGFVLDNFNDIDITDRLNTWILASVIRNAQQLSFTTKFPNKFHLHQCLFTCKSLTKLVVGVFSGRLILSLPDSITLPSLKTLSLHSVMFKGDENVTDRLFSSCPVSESLIMKNCVFPHDNINIPSPQLQHLVLKCCRTWNDLLDSDPSVIKLKLCAPNLISFYHYDAMSTCCDLKNLCSLVKADINVYARCRWSKKKNAMYAPHMNYYSDDEEDPYCDEINIDPAIERDCWEAGLSLECLLNNLKCCELRDVNGRISELEFLEILLKNAMQCSWINCSSFLNQPTQMEHILNLVRRCLHIQEPPQVL